MKTYNELLELITKAILLESNNNFLIKYDVHFTMYQSLDLLSFSLRYKVDDGLTTKPIDFRIHSNEATNKIQSYYWQLAAHLDRFNLTH